MLQYCSYQRLSVCFKSVAVAHLSLCLYCMKFLTVHFKKAITRNSANSCCIQNPNFSARSSAIIRCSCGPSLVGNSKIPLKAVEEFRMDVRLDPKVVVIIKEDYRGGVLGIIDWHACRLAEDWSTCQKTNGEELVAQVMSHNVIGHTQIFHTGVVLVYTKMWNHLPIFHDLTAVFELLDYALMPCIFLSNTVPVLSLSACVSLSVYQSPASDYCSYKPLFRYYNI